MPKNLLDFLYAESFEPTTDEMLSALFEKAKEIEDLEVKKEPLAKALKKFGFEGKVDVDENGIYAKLDDGCPYTDFAAKLKTAEAITELAGLGWVPAFGNDVASNADAPCYIIYFIEIDEVEPSNEDKVPDLETLIKDVTDFENEGHAKGIGANLEAPKEGEKPAKIKDEPKAKSAIKDSVEESLQAARQKLAAVGVTISKTSDGEFKVRLKDSPPDHGYFATDLDDAVATGLEMAREKAAKAN